MKDHDVRTDHRTKYADEFRNYQPSDLTKRTAQKAIRNVVLQKKPALGANGPLLTYAVADLQPVNEEKETRRRERSRAWMELMRERAYGFDKPEQMKDFKMVSHSDLGASMIRWKKAYEMKKTRKEMNQQAQRRKFMTQGEIAIEKAEILVAKRARAGLDLMKGFLSRPPLAPMILSHQTLYQPPLS